MSDGAMILIIFALIALLGGGTTALVLLLVNSSRKRKLREYTSMTTGTIVRRRNGGLEHPTVVWVRYEVDGVAYECHESVRLTSKAIKLGPVPIGQEKVEKIPSEVGYTVRVAYLPTDPSKAILADNQGIMNV